MKDFAAKENLGVQASSKDRPETGGDEELRRANDELRQQVSSLQKINQSLMDSEQRLRLAIATGQIGLWVWNSTDVTNAGDWSPRLKEIFGLALDTEVTHEIFLRCVHPEDRDRVNTEVMNALGGANGGEYCCDYRIVHQGNGAPRRVTARGQAFFDSKGAPVRFIGTVMDITERKMAEEAITRLNADLEQRVAERTDDLARSNRSLHLEIEERRRAEEKLRRSEAYLAEAQRLSRTGSFGWNVATGELVWSDETFCILGYSRTVKPSLELVFERIHPEDAAFVRQTLNRANHEEDHLDFEHRLLMPDGSIKHVHVLAQLAKTGASALEYVGAVMDITEEKHAEEALRRSEAYLAEAQKLSQTGSFCVRITSRELICSAQTVQIGGWAPGTKPTLEQSLERVHPDDRLRVSTTLEKALQDEAFLEYEHRLLMPDGTIRHVHTVANPIRDASGEIELVGAVADITQRKLAAEALRASEHLARGQLDAVAKMLEVLARESDPDQLPRHVVNAIQIQLKAFSVTIWERNNDRLDLLGVTEEGRFLTRSEAGYFEGSIPVAGHAPPLWVEALHTGSHILIEDIDREPTRIVLDDGRAAIWRHHDLTRPFFELKDHLSAQGVRWLLICPLSLAGRLAGIIGIRFKGTRTFGRQEIELTKALSHQAMLAIQLMRLSQQSRRAAVVAERNRMARDIHDTLAQGFTGVIMQLQAAKGAAARSEMADAAAHIERAEELARSNLGEARRSVRALRPRSLNDGTLCMAMEDLLKRASIGTDLKAEFHLEGEHRLIPLDWEEGLLRITQESLTNTIKHAQARTFRATLTFEPAQIRLQLIDDGRGFDPQLEHDGLGLLGMKERVDQMGGLFTVRSRPGHATEILIALEHPNPSRGAGEIEYV